MNEKSLLTLRTIVLERTRHEVVLADNGEKGINMFDRPCPVITILDLHLPDVDGIEVLSRLRAIRSSTLWTVAKGWAVASGGD
jgi:DNA-binding response OmpR family regulator